MKTAHKQSIYLGLADLAAVAIISAAIATPTTNLVNAAKENHAQADPVGFRCT